MHARHHTPMAWPDLPLPDETVVQKLRQGIAQAGIDCACREVANEILDRVDAAEELVRRAGGLADARRMRDAIVMVLGLLGELDDVMPDEPDQTVFHEIAGLFRDISDFAAFGSEAARRAAGGDAR